MTTEAIPLDRIKDGDAQMRVVHIPTADIFVPPGRRPIDPDKVKQLADSIEKIGMLMPITVAYDDTVTRLVAGAHRLAAAKRLRMSEVPAVVLVAEDARLRLAEIAENLHRNELTALERDELLAEWIHLTEARREVSAQVAPKPQGGRPEGGIRAAARELGVDRDDARRAVKVASLAPEAKQAARDAGLEDNRSALLAAAKEDKPEKQVEVLKARAENTAEKPKPKVDRKELERKFAQLERDNTQKFSEICRLREANEKLRAAKQADIHLDTAWDGATKKQRTEFLRSRWIEIMRLRDEIGSFSLNNSQPVDDAPHCALEERGRA